MLSECRWGMTNRGPVQKCGLGYYNPGKNRWGGWVCAPGCSYWTTMAALPALHGLKHTGLQVAGCLPTAHAATDWCHVVHAGSFVTAVTLATPPCGKAAPVPATASSSPDGTLQYGMPRSCCMVWRGATNCLMAGEVVNVSSSVLAPSKLPCISMKTSALLCTDVFCGSLADCPGSRMAMAPCTPVMLGTSPLAALLTTPAAAAPVALLAAPHSRMWRKACRTATVSGGSKRPLAAAAAGCRTKTYV
jgi:hypothetical protein